MYACLPCFLFVIHRKISSALPSADKSKTKQTGVTALKFINPWPERVWSLVKSPIDVKQSIAASHTIVQTIKKILVLKNLKLNPALTLGLGFLEAFLCYGWCALGKVWAQLWFYIHVRTTVHWCTMVSHTRVYNGVVTVVCKIHNLQLLASTILVLQQQNGNACANFTMSILLVSVCNSQYSQHTFEEWHVQISQCQARFLSIPLFSSFRRVGTFNSQLWLEFHILALPC